MSGPRIGSLCTGYGGLDVAVQYVLGGELAWVADNDPGAAKILAHRFPRVPNLGDITTANWSGVPPVDVLAAGFPCQDVSCAGGRAGLREGTRTGVWAHVARAVEALRPRLVVLENVGGLLSASADSDMEPCPWCVGDAGTESALRALGAVLGDLAEVGFDAQWRCVRASDAGAPHKRERVFILAWPAADAGRYPWAEDLPDSASAAGGSRGAVRAAAPEDPHGPACGERRLPAPGQTPGRGSRPDAGGPGGAPVAADAPGHRPAGDAALAVVDRGQAWERPGTGDRFAPADADRSDGAAGVEPPPRRRALGGAGAPVDRAGDGGAVDWRQFTPAIRRWERVLGRPAPRPTEPGRTGERLSPRFVEWLMGLPEGWVTGVPGLSRNAQLKALGNGVVPQQAELALHLLLAGLTESAAA